MKKNILITGVPKSGKSTLLNKIIGGIPHKVGFITHEILGEHGRLGFEIETHLGHKAVLAHVDFKTSHKVSKYSVCVENLESLIPEVSLFGNTEILYLDEIGEMELFSEKFKELALRFFDSPNTSLLTLSDVYRDEFTESIRKRDDVIVVDISAHNREEKEKFILQLLGKIEKAGNYVTEKDRFAKEGGKVIVLNSEHNARTLIHKDDHWSCNCNFFQKHHICSHSIATEEFMEDQSKH